MLYFWVSIGYFNYLKKKVIMLMIIYMQIAVIVYHRVDLLSTCITSHYTRYFITHISNISTEHTKKLLQTCCY